LNSETIEQLILIKDWELGQQRAQHVVVDKEMEDYFKNLWLDGDGTPAGDAAADVGST
jgi:hypothetical protein